jgi:hypothetical protein
MVHALMNHALSSRAFDDFGDLNTVKDATSITAFLSKHAESAQRIAEGISDYKIPHFDFLRLDGAARKRIRRSFSNNIVLQNTLLKRTDREPRRRYASQFISSLFEEFPDRGLMKSAIYAYFELRSSYPDSPYAAQIGQSYLEYAFFAYGVYFETGGRVLSLRSFEDLLDAFDKHGVELTDGLKLYQLQTFIEKTAEGVTPYYTSARAEFEALTGYSEDDFRAIPSERIFPMEEYDPEDWKAALLPLETNQSEVDRFRLVAREFIESRDELDTYVSEKEMFRFQNVSCASERNPSKGSKLREEVREKYEMDDEPFQFKRTLINVSTSNYRDAWINTPASRAKLKYFEILVRRMIRNVPEIPDGDMEYDGYAEHFRYSSDYNYVMGDLKKWGITFPVYLIRIFCEEAERRFPVGWVKLAEQFEKATLWVGEEPIKIGTRGFGLGNLNYMSSVIHYLILKMTNADKFVVRSDDSLAAYRKTDSPFYEVYLKERLGFIVNRKKINISSKANVFCENYAEVESKFQSQIYEKLGYMTGQIGQVMRKVCNSLSAKYHIATACDLALPTKSLIDFLVSMNFMIFGPEFHPDEITLDHWNGGWTKKYYSTNFSTEYIALEEDLDALPEKEDLIKKIYKNKLHAVAPSDAITGQKEYYPLLQKLVFPDAQVEKECLEGQMNVIVPCKTPFQYVQEVNDQLGTTQRINKNPFLRQRKWIQLQKKRQKRFSRIDSKKDYFETSDILLERIYENFEAGKGGYAIPYTIFEPEEYEYRQVQCIGSALGSDGAQVKVRKKPLSLEEEDRVMTEFLKEIRQGRLPVDIPRFDLWHESKKVLYSMNEYNNGILCVEDYVETIKSNEKFLAYFNVPTELAYFDWCTRHALQGSADVYRKNFKFKIPEKGTLYDPKLFKRYSAFPGPDPRRLDFYGVHFYVHPDEYEVITSGLRLMKYKPEFEVYISDLFNLLYQEGIIAPNFMMRRDELLAEQGELRHKKECEGHQASDDDLLLEMLQWRAQIDAESKGLSIEEYEEQIRAVALTHALNSSGVEATETSEVNKNTLEDLFSGDELDDLPAEEDPSEDQEEFDFSYDYDDSYMADGYVSDS